MRRVGRLLKNELVTGVALLAPISGTIYLFYLIASAIDGLFPYRYQQQFFGRELPGLGIVSVLVLALLVGVFAHNFFGRRMVMWFDRMFQRMPLFGGTYGLIKQVFESVFSQGAESFNRAVLIEYPREGIHTIAFVTSSHAPIASRSGEPLISVFVPTTPNPTSGFYLLVEKRLVRELDMPVEQAFKLVITMGIAKEPDILTTTSKMLRPDLTTPDAQAKE